MAKTIVSYNLNGIRAALSKSLLAWLKQHDIDIFCVQETKAQPDQVAERQEFEALGYEQHWHSAEKKGYSGVATFSRIPPDDVIVGCGIDKYDREGRILRTDFGDWTLLNCYFPSGTTGDERQAFKMEFLDDFFRWVGELKKERPKLIIVGDYNIAHTEIDIHDPVRNKTSSGFLPEERAWLTRVFDEIGYVDVFRKLNPDPDHYTWWSNRGQAWAKNVGWRIDYQIATPDIASKAREAAIYKESRFSDHAPLIIHYDHS